MNPQLRSIKEIEPMTRYEPGGYHPLKVNDVLQGRYLIIDKLGHGNLSTVWLAKDLKAKEHCYYAIKVNMAKNSSTPVLAEGKVLRELRRSWFPLFVPGRELIPRVFDEFKLEGPNGTHACLVTSPSCVNLRELSDNHLFPMQVARAFAAKIATAVRFVHSRRIIHGDIHLANILLPFREGYNSLSLAEYRASHGYTQFYSLNHNPNESVPVQYPTEATVPLCCRKRPENLTVEDAHRLLLCDFGDAFKPRSDVRLGRECRTPATKRAPEAFFSPDLLMRYASDIWGLGLVFWELVAKEPLFVTACSGNEIVAQQLDVLGNHFFPSHWARVWCRAGSDVGLPRPRPIRRPIGPRVTRLPLEVTWEALVEERKENQGELGAFRFEERQAFLELIRGMLRFNPKERYTLDQVMHSEWMVRWALPALAQTQ
ncbi:protein kinase [Xylaria bambusicola]|uniref:protein kinase n=1 Tax=Xylaria bambusicola TaxID=326684 RepID=UPI002008418E|nr:protein kinase [Xylaria bambusicola]KAI0512965.1 protein kinase [Xylaria bambusicola]